MERGGEKAVYDRVVAKKWCNYIPPSKESSFNGNKNLKFQQRDAFRFSSKLPLDPDSPE